MRRLKKVPLKPPYSASDDIEVEFELPWGKKMIVPGTILRFKLTRGRYTFILVATNVITGKTWIDCRDMKTQTWRSFYVDQLAATVKPRRRPA